MNCSLLKSFLSLLCISFLFSCNYKRKADKIFFNGNIYLVDNNFSVAEAFAIQNGKIKQTGTTQDILDGFNSTEKIDLKGATVFPGFIDSHCHFYGYSTDLLKCDLYGTKSFGEIINRISDYSKTNKFQWLLGRGWDQNDWDDKTYPTNSKLDSLFPDIPVYLMRIDGHAALCNSIALKLAGITKDTKITGGEILNENGKLTGLLIDNAVDLVKNHIPPFTRELTDSALLIGQENCLAAGLTTLDDAGLGKDSIFQMLELQKSGKLKIRIYAMISDEQSTLDYFFDKGPFKSDRMSVNAVKIYADGALGSRGACMKKEYSDQKGHYGFMLHTTEYFDKIAEKALEHGFQMCTHAIGDSAVKVIINTYSQHLSSDNHRRWRIEHCQVVDPKEMKSMGENSIVPSVQPTHATSDMYWVKERIGEERLPNAYAYENLRDACDGIIAFGTDFPVENINPVYTFYAAVTRKDLSGFPKKGFLSDNKLKRKESIKAMTIYGAYANFEDEEKGSLEEGKYADFVILNQDMMKAEESDIPKTKVVATYINGELVYEKK